MGGGASKNKSKKLDQPEPHKTAPIPEVKPENPLAPQSPNIQTVPPRLSTPENRSPSINNRPPSVHSPPPSIHSQAPPIHSRPHSTRSQASNKYVNSSELYVLTSNNYENTNQSNGTGSRASSRHKQENNNPQNHYDDPLPSIIDPPNRSKSRSSELSLSSSASSRTPLPTIDPARKNSASTLTSHKHSHRTHSVHGQVGRCSHCPHCQRMKRGRTITTSPKPKWILDNRPINDQFQIIMDEYDIEAVKKKVVSENGHLPGSYDYRPQLTIEQIDDYDIQKENYYTQPVVAKTSPRVSPARTPFPEYVFLQRREQRLNKPYSLPLFVE